MIAQMLRPTPRVSHVVGICVWGFVHGDFALGLGEAFGDHISHIFHVLSPECFAPTGFTGLTEFWVIDLFVWICAWGFRVGVGRSFRA
jgi:hypothetical protein